MAEHRRLFLEPRGLCVLRRQAGGGRTETGEPITGRDLIALLATIGIDLGLLALAILNPPPRGRRNARRGRAQRQISAAIDTAIARAGVDREWVHRHFIHHSGASYLVIPNLYSCDPKNKEEMPPGRWR